MTDRETIPPMDSTALSVEPSEFRASVGYAWWNVFLSMPFMFVPFVAIPLLANGIRMLVGSVRVDQSGIEALPHRFGVGFRARWNEIESWEDGVLDPLKELKDPPADTRRCLRFRIRGQNLPARITEGEVAHPGYDRLMALVRIALGEPTNV
jgi:hypothetical protein